MGGLERFINVLAEHARSRLLEQEHLEIGWTEE